MLKIVVNNEEPELVAEIRRQLKEKTDGYCPCFLIRDEDHKCMCKAFREQTTPGECHCGLYKKIEVKEK